MITKKDRQLLIDDMKEVFATKDELKAALDETKSAVVKAVVKDVTGYLHDNVIPLLNEHEARLDRLEKTIGGFRPLTD